MYRAEIKEKAKEILGPGIFANNWLMLLLVLLVQTVAIYAASSIVTGAGGLLIAGPLSYGISLILLKLVRTREKIAFQDLLKGFTDDFLQNFLLALLMSLFISLWSLLFVIPGIVKSYAYSMAFYVKADHPEYNWKQCLSESIRITNGHKMELFILDLSFIGWYFVGSLCLGVGTLWVTPYRQTTWTLYYEELKNA